MTIAVTILAIALPVPAHAAEAIEFVDMRPAVIDVATAKTGQRWRVPVIDSRPGRRALSLTVAFRPAGVLRVERSRLTLDAGEVGSFVVTLRRPLEGSGELILSSDGVIVRRAISTSRRPGRVAVPISRLQFAGVRLTPFSERVRAGSVTVPDAPGSADGRVGLLTSRRGDTAEVVRGGDTFAVAGASRPGEYQGTVDLLPGTPGGEADGVLRVRDLPVWPLLVLILGLLVVQLLDRYQHRERPRQMLDLRLARLRDRALDVQRDLNDTYRIAAGPREPNLLLDTLAAEARSRYDDELTDAERARWDVEGAEYRKVAALVESFETLAESIRALSSERLATAADEQAERALDASPVGRALRGRRLLSAVDLADALTEVAEARDYLRDFRRLYRQATELAAQDLLAKLRAGPERLAALEEQVQERYRAWSPGVRVEMPRREPQPQPGYPFPPPASWEPSRSRARRRWPVLVAGAAGLVLVSCLAVFFLALTRDQDFGAAPAPTQAAPSATALPELPVAPEPKPPPALDLGPAEPSTWQLGLYGGIVPLLLTGAAIGVAELARRRWKPRRTALDSTLLNRRVRRADRRFALAGGTLVVLSGMSVLYFANPTFGTPGDYLAVALWGTAFGEGLTLARRLWPIPA
ncbi:hypothetical protein [Actinoplanes aureus]|uniref:Uncharacterized protein n=1 Tax=Actinoplanes aureus TaxID=2792083 RepID=A0A931CC48_9ACTN|nr:hypothetical protein [Actinoplanes aureus]MBG0564413.1 hypothetical protein [Actinoplanes aureus]